MPPVSTERCSCGHRLHYSDPMARRKVDGLIRSLGPTLHVQVTGADYGYLVPRHYLALHGLKASELDELAQRYGWERV